MAKMRQFEDLVVGEKATSDVRKVTEEEMLAFARSYDPQWFHTDPEAAKDSEFGEVIASGIFTAALWRQLDHTISGDIDFICGIAWEDTRWPTALRAGDIVQADTEILELRASSSDPSRGVGTFQYRLKNQNGDTVFICRSINLIRRAS